jgi:hypothetical protein
VDSPTFVHNATAFGQNPSFFTMSHYSRYAYSSPAVVLLDTCSSRSNAN